MFMQMNIVKCDAHTCK